VQCLTIYYIENFGKAWHLRVVTSDNEEQEQVAKKRCMIPVSDTDSTEDEGMVDYRIFLRKCYILLFTLILNKSYINITLVMINI